MCLSLHVCMLYAVDVRVHVHGAPRLCVIEEARGVNRGDEVPDAQHTRPLGSPTLAEIEAEIELEMKCQGESQD